MFELNHNELYTILYTYHRGVRNGIVILDQLIELFSISWIFIKVTPSNNKENSLDTCISGLKNVMLWNYAVVDKCMCRY